MPHMWHTFETNDSVWMCRPCRYKRLKELVLINRLKSNYDGQKE